LQERRHYQYSIILPTCNRSELVCQFLDSVQKQTRLPYEVVVVDQSDDTRTKEVFDSWICDHVKKKYIHRTVKSLILARNIGIDACDETDLVVFLDDDILLSTKFCEEVVLIFEGDTQGRYAAGMGTVDNLRHKSKLLQAFFLMPYEGNGKFLASGAPTFPHWKRDFTETEFVSGGCTFWRREIIKEYRFDERLSDYGHGDDVDVSYRISRKYKLFLQPKAVCFQEANPPGRDLGRKYRQAWIQNMYYLAQKNGVSLIAYFWCVFGHFLRDLVCLDFRRLQGDFEGTWNIIRGRIDTVVGYDEFIKEKKGRKLTRGSRSKEVRL